MLFKCLDPPGGVHEVNHVTSVQDNQARDVGPDTLIKGGKEKYETVRGHDRDQGKQGPGAGAEVCETLLDLTLDGGGIWNVRGHIVFAFHRCCYGSGAGPSRSKLVLKRLVLIQDSLTPVRNE